MNQPQQSITITAWPIINTASQTIKCAISRVQRQLFLIILNPVLSLTAGVATDRPLPAKRIDYTTGTYRILLARRGWLRSPLTTVSPLPTFVDAACALIQWATSRVNNCNKTTWARGQLHESGGNPHWSHIHYITTYIYY